MIAKTTAAAFVACAWAMPGVAITSASAQERLVEISPDDTVLVERYVETAPPAPVYEEHLTLRPGSTVPEAVPLRSLGDAPSLRRYAYFLSVDRKIVVVDPASRTVVRILDMKG